MLRPCLHMSQLLILPPYPVLPPLGRYSLDQLVHSLREEFTSNGHFNFIKGVLEDTIRVDDIDFSQYAIQIDTRCPWLFGRQHKLDTRPGLQTPEDHTLGLNFFNAVIGTRRIAISRQPQRRRFCSNGMK